MISFGQTKFTSQELQIATQIFGDATMKLTAPTNVAFGVSVKHYHARE